MLAVVLSAVGACALSFGFVAGVRRWARLHQLDIPNARSAHTTPTPRGGGIGIVITSLLAAVALWWIGYLHTSLAAALIGGGAAVAVIGHMDDRWNIAAAPRLMTQIIAAAFALVCVGGPAILPIGNVDWLPGAVGWGIALVGLVWMINLTNFMDGIDGLVGSHAIFVSLSAGGLLWAAGAPGEAWFLLLLASAVAGFLVFNWPPASIFMGDVSSGFLGLVIAVVAIATAGTVNLWAWGLLLTPFIADATVTRAVRIWRYGDWHGAHRSHLYQQLSRRMHGHAPVLYAYWALSLLGVLPLAVFVAVVPAVGWIVMPLTWCLACVAVFRLGAGRDDTGPAA